MAWSEPNGNGKHFRFYFSSSRTEKSTFRHAIAFASTHNVCHVKDRASFWLIMHGNHNVAIETDVIFNESRTKHKLRQSNNSLTLCQSSSCCPYSTHYSSSFRVATLIRSCICTLQPANCQVAANGLDR